MQKKDLTTRKVAQAIADDTLSTTEQKLRNHIRQLATSYLALRQVVQEQRRTIAALQ